LNNPVGFVHANLDILTGYIDKLADLVDAPAVDDLPGSVEGGTPAQRHSLFSEINSIIADCREGADRVRDIVGNLRTFSRLDEAEYKETEINEGIDATIRLLSQYLSSGNITITRNYGELPPMGAFSSQLNQVWMNLLVNSAQAIGAGKGEIEITTRCDSSNIYVEVRDTGCGIAIQHLNRLFDPFYTTKPIGEGTGLGLSISFGIVERHGGSITVDTRLGEGATFKVTLPRDFEPNFVSMAKSIAPSPQYTTGELPYAI
jgi:two-component system, NtrC family, sensor kinase